MSLSQKTVKKPVFFDFLDFEFQKLVEQKLFANMKAYFSTLAVKRIRENSKTIHPSGKRLRAETLNQIALLVNYRM
jgi:hypothetical protein